MAIGVDTSKVNSGLNELLRATTIRIRRCVAVKRVALQKIRADSPEARAYGFKHLNRIIELQIASYPRYITNIGRFLTEESIKEKVAFLEPLDKGFFGRIRFSNSRNNLEYDIAMTEEKFESIEKQANLIYEIVIAQRKLLKPNMSGDEEANFRKLITVEFEKSEELIRELNSCMQFVFRAINTIKIMQIRFIKFLEKCKANNFSNVIDDSKAFCDRLEKHISAFYAFKSWIQLLGFSIAFFSPIKEIRFIGFGVAGGAFGVDLLVDFVSGLPETRRRLNKILRRVDEEEIKQKQLTAEILASVQRMPSKMPDFL